MGLNKKDIRSVINRDLPPTAESYLRQSGRAGRDGQLAQAIVLASLREVSGPVGTDGPLRAAAAGDSGPLTRYLRGDRCRRDILVEALGTEPEACSGCDVCDGLARADG